MSTTPKKQIHHGTTPLRRVVLRRAVTPFRPARHIPRLSRPPPGPQGAGVALAPPLLVRALALRALSLLRARRDEHANECMRARAQTSIACPNRVCSSCPSAGQGHEYQLRAGRRHLHEKRGVRSRHRVARVDRCYRTYVERVGVRRQPHVRARLRYETATTLTWYPWPTSCATSSAQTSSSTRRSS